MSTTRLTDGKLRDRVWDIVTKSERRTDVVDLMVELIGDEKARSYGLGYQDGGRRAAPFLARG